MQQKNSLFKLAHYEVLKKISSNKLETIYLAHDNILERYVSIKILSKEYSNNLDFLIKFFREVRTIARISHPNIVQIYDISEENQQYYIVTERIEGQNLREYLNNNNNSLNTLLPIFIDICKLLKYVWNKEGIFHGNISDKEIIITTRSQCKLNNLAQNQFLTYKKNQDYEKIYFSSPEQILNITTDFRSDIYHLGIVLYKMITGVFPFNGKNAKEISQKHLSQDIPNPQKYNKSLPNSFIILLNKMLAKHPNDRYHNYDGLLEDFKLIKNDMATKKFKIFFYINNYIIIFIFLLIIIIILMMKN